MYAVDPKEFARAECRAMLQLDHPAVFMSGTKEELNELFTDDTVHAVFVCSQTDSHYSITRTALLHGKAVFCEKPVSLNAVETEELYRIAAEKGLPLHCSFNRRYDPQVRELKSRLSSGEVGQIHLVKTCSRDHPRPPTDFLKVSGGFIHDCASHDLDMVCWLVGAFPERVFATATTHDPEIGALKDTDTAVIVLNFPSTASGRPGPIAVIDISRHGVYGYDQRIEVLGDGGMMRSENQQEDSVVFNAPGTTCQGPIRNSFPQRYAASYVNSLDNFLSTVNGALKAEISGHDVLNISKLATCCEESIKCGQPVDFRVVNYDFQQRHIGLS
uniref:Putative oxidoreductase YrbE n=1 Tax=Schistocephalus solidus TaxID=70667 RepID=A0A0X3PWJ0_SCHSO